MTINPYKEVFADPKPKAKRLQGKARQRRKQELYDREGGLCQGCGKPFPLTVEDKNGKQVFDYFRCGHMSHIKSQGAGGGDELENLMYHCFWCHRQWENRYGIYRDRQ